jgi:hypothetical protein
MVELVGNTDSKRQQYGVIARRRITRRVSQQRRQNKLLAMGKRLINIIRTRSLSEPDFPEAQGWYAQDENTKKLWATQSQTRLESHTPSFSIFR